MTPKNSKKLILLVLIVLALVASVFWKESLDLASKNSSKTKSLTVLVTIKPIYSLVAGLTKDVPGVRTELLLTPPNSPHTFHLKPSDVQKIVGANLVVWVGPELENFLVASLKNLKAESKTLSLSEKADLKLLAIRQDKNWGAHEHGHDDHEDHHDHDDHHDDHDHHEHHEHHHDGSIDAHIWLNTQNAEKIILTVSNKLQQMDPEHAALYLHNQNNLIKKLKDLKQEITENLKPVKNKPFLVFHDAYQYFEKEFGLKAHGSITVNPQVPLSAQRLNQIQHAIRHDKIQCVFSEPEFKQGIVEKLLNNTKAKNLELDPLGARIEAAKNQEEDIYFDLMRGLSHRFKNCLSEN